MSDFFSSPYLQHNVFSPREMAMICDIANPGFLLDRQVGEEMVIQSLRLSVEDSFRLYPGVYEQKWEIDRPAMSEKLRKASAAEILQAARQVDDFWESVTRGQYARSFAARGGAATKGISTPAKRRAARRNAKLGGRPGQIIKFRCGGRLNLTAGQSAYWKRRAQRAGLITMTRPATSGEKLRYDLHWSIPAHADPEVRTWCSECAAKF